MYCKEITVQLSRDEVNQKITSIIQTANQFSSHISVNQGAIRVNAKSMLGLLSMGLSKGSQITLTAEGSDAEESLSALSSLLA